MEDSPKFFVGIDVSKPHFDASLLIVIGDTRPIQTERFEFKYYSGSLQKETKAGFSVSQHPQRKVPSSMFKLLL